MEVVDVILKRNGKRLSVYKDHILKAYLCFSCFGDGDAFTNGDFECNCGDCEGVGEFSIEDVVEVSSDIDKIK